MTPESKDLVNSSSGGDFSKPRVREAKKIVDRLINAKKAYDSLRTTILRWVPTNAANDKLEKALLNALEKNNQPVPIDKAKLALGAEEIYPYYGPTGEAEYPLQVNAVGS